jgi:predicted MPP superfamily phosphohydrolase
MHHNHLRRRFRVWHLLLFFLVVFLAGFWWGERIEVVRIHLPPAATNQSFRFAVLSDIHIGANGHGMSRWKRAMAMVNREQPDAILLLGDYVTSHKGIPALDDALKGIHAPLGVYAVLGNHDHWAGSEAVAEALGRHGIEVLNNRAVCLRKAQDEVWLVGIDDLWSGKPDWQRAFRGGQPGAKVILLSHNPDAALAPQREKASLILSGHTHGGHIWLPLVWLLSRAAGFSLIPHTKYGSRYPHGLRREQATWVYVTKGVTAGNRLPRWFNAREVVIVEVGHPPMPKDAPSTLANRNPSRRRVPFNGQFQRSR